jgi:hypothetical protein
LGLNITFLNAVKSALGDYIAFLAGDDYWIVENKLEMQIQLLLSNKKIAFVHTEYKKLNELNNKITHHANKNWKSILLEKTGKYTLVAMLCHKWSGYPLSSSSCFRKEPLLKGINGHPEILNYNAVGEGTILHTSMSYYGGLYAFIPIQTTMYRVRKKSLSHYESKTEQFDYRKSYYFLKLLTAESFSLHKNDIHKIQKNAIFTLFREALSLDVMKEFHLFLQTQTKRGDNNWWQYFIILKIIKLKTFRVVLSIMLKSISKLQSILRKIK